MYSLWMSQLCYLTASSFELVFEDNFKFFIIIVLVSAQQWAWLILSQLVIITKVLR